MRDLPLDKSLRREGEILRQKFEKNMRRGERKFVQKLNRN